jgi:hypothetical protein
MNKVRIFALTIAWIVKSERAKPHENQASRLAAVFTSGVRMWGQKARETQV